MKTLTERLKLWESMVIPCHKDNNDIFMVTIPPELKLAQELHAQNAHYRELLGEWGEAAKNILDCQVLKNGEYVGWRVGSSSLAGNGLTDCAVKLRKALTKLQKEGIV